ncbi:MAG: hypothetical protein Unbinned2990contig1001_10 [Prokaryotic dsDNA virus sp.]|nr:MAG: hypothetical protein Unbinned2990contig1001_10 [Prokaryotic dsDNA virus sp.]
MHIQLYTDIIISLIKKISAINKINAIKNKNIYNKLSIINIAIIPIIINNNIKANLVNHLININDFSHH